MILAFFIIGALTSLGCGLNIIAGKANAYGVAAWIVGGAIGALMMYAAIQMGGAA